MRGSMVALDVVKICRLYPYNPVCVPVQSKDYICMYVCMSLCLYVCMSVCLYVCMSVCIDVFMSLCLYVFMSLCLYVCMY